MTYLIKKFCNYKSNFGVVEKPGRCKCESKNEH